MFSTQKLLQNEVVSEWKCLTFKILSTLEDPIQFWAVLFLILFCKVFNPKKMVSNHELCDFVIFTVQLTLT